jgi:ring-1,2-phenylacetyl-CoA epoxidase subunit PaaC
MNPDLKEALVHKLLSMADDELILGHRDSEWTGHAPILEEDIAFANIALDEIGHAKIWYTLLANLADEDLDTYPDRLVFFRGSSDYRNLQLVELPNGDWAFSILRQYLFDAAEVIRLEHLVHSKYPSLAEAAAKIRKEEIYHYRHTHAWIQRLGLGTTESCQRTQNALNRIWPYTLQLFEPLPDESLLVEVDWVPEPGQLRSAWLNLVGSCLEEAGLAVPENLAPVSLERDQHTHHLATLLIEMQEVARLDPEARW